MVLTNLDFGSECVCLTCVNAYSSLPVLLDKTQTEDQVAVITVRSPGLHSHLSVLFDLVCATLNTCIHVHTYVCVCLQ